MNSLTSPGHREKVVTLLRKLYRELRVTLNHDEKYVYETSMWRYIMGLSKRFQTSDFEKDKLTMETKSLLSIGQSYLTYLESSREYDRINTTYRGKGELTPEETATRLGLRMPSYKQGLGDQQRRDFNNKSYYNNNNNSFNNDRKREGKGMSSENMSNLDKWLEQKSRQQFGN